MPIDRKKWNTTFVDFPAWECPRCNDGRFIERPGAGFSEETASTRIIKDGPDWEPDWFRHRFAKQFECSNEDCKEIAVVCGTSSPVELNDYDSQTQEWVDNYTVTSIDPAPCPITVPEETPAEVMFQIYRASTLYWVDANAAANALRKALEEIMNERKVAKRFTNRRGKHRWYTLHRRIELYGNTKPELEGILMAAKWLGNVGSHTEKNCSRDDVLDAFELMGEIISQIYDDTSKKIKTMANEIVRRKGPRRKS